MSAFAASQQELKGVSSEISRQKQSLASQSNKLDKLQSELKKQELSIAGLEKEIEQTKRKLASANANIQKLETKISKLAEQKKQQSDKLEQLIHAYYVMKDSHSASSLLEDGSEEDRLSQYFQYLAKARANAIEELEDTTRQLRNSEDKLNSEKQQIQSLLTEQTQKRDSLQTTQNKRKSTVSKIRSDISSDKVYLAELQRNESRLKAEIAKAAKRNSVLMNGIASQKGKLPWPLKGRVLHHFGSHQTGQINWKGIVIDANYGQPVKAIYSGRVVFSEYLRGYGLVILLDHGKGDMTLYGFNQSLLKKEGDKVVAGETIALAGDTGGQSSPALYFEVRRNSRAENPLNWLN
ncbi:murein hydrolase activator EnvC [Vibrio sp.]|nr:murein hydrolase activator EnvC [Vibrio sp.]